MAFFWFLVAVLFFVLWLRKKPASPDASPQISAAYDHGFLDGWKDLSFKLESEISGGAIRQEDLHKYMNVDAIWRARQSGPVQVGGVPGVPTVATPGVSPEVPLGQPADAASGPAPNVAPDFLTTAGQPPVQQSSPGQPGPGVSLTTAGQPPVSQPPFVQPASVQQPALAAHSPRALPWSLPGKRGAGTPVTPPVRVESAEERQERVARRNLNVMLYVASFLLVAAAAAFIASSAPAPVRLTLLWGVTGLFYLGGLGLHWRSVVLRPAAISFVGTGLAILPFAGLSLSLLAEVEPTTAWFITSLVGLVAYAIATIVLQKAVIAYLTLAFVLSLGTSSANVLQLALVWSFVSVMVVGLLAHLVTTFWPRALPEVFAKPLDQTARFVTPLALVASLSAVSRVSLGEYALIFGVAALQYFVYWVQQRSYLNEAITRVLALFSLSLLGFWLAERDYLFIAWWMVALICVNALYSLIRVRLEASLSVNIERIWLLVSLIGLLGTSNAWDLANRLFFGASLNLLLVILIAGACVLRFQDVVWAYAALAASVALPFAVGAWLTHIDWMSQLYPWLFLVASCAALAVIHWSARTGRFTLARDFAVVAYWTYLVAATVTAIDSYVEVFYYNMMLVSLRLALFAALAAAGALIYSYVKRQLVGEMAGFGYLALALTSLAWNISDDHTWHGLGIVVSLYVLIVLAGVLHSMRRESERAILAFAAAQGVGLFLAVGLAQEETRLVTTLLALALALGSAARYFFGNDDFLSRLYAFSTIPYFVVAVSGAVLLSFGWQLLVLSSITATYWYMSYHAKQPLITVGANVAAAGAVVVAVNWGGVTMEWFGPSAGLASALVFAIWYGVATTRRDRERAWIHAVSLWFVLAAGALGGLGSIAGYSSKPAMLAACGLLALLAVAVAAHGYFLRLAIYFEIAAFIFSFAAQAAVYLAWDGVPVIVFGHLTALTLVAVALWRKRNGGVTELHYVVAAAVFTAAGGASALFDGSIYQLIFLAEHVVILIVGALRQWQRVVWWGVAASVAAIMYFLKDYFYLWLAFLGIILIAIVVWRLVRINKEKQRGGYQQSVSGHQQPPGEQFAPNGYQPPLNGQYAPSEYQQSGYQQGVQQSGYPQGFQQSGHQQPPNRYQQPPREQFAPNGYQQGGYPQFPSEHQQAGEYQQFPNEYPQGFQPPASSPKG
ncbi:MAG: hypothetical protein QM705_06165 [Ancrocorticia sp.]